jgi:membrane-associated protease RseP (regulator of RpoE activity)
VSLLLNVLGILLVALGVGVSIALHELGHLIPAKRFGVRCAQYMIGFGPTLWSRTRGDTQYGIKAIPLGGYVKMIGMYAPRVGDEPGMLRTSRTGRMSALVDQARSESLEEIAPGDEHRVFYKLSVPKKVVVMLGGPVMNLVLATVLFAVMLSGVGLPTYVPRVSTVAGCVPTTAPTVAKPNPDCQPGDPQAPSAVAGLRQGDTIVAADGRAVTLWSDLTAVIRTSGGKDLVLTVDRDGQQVTLTAPVASLARAKYDDKGQLLANADGTVQTETVGYLGASASTDYVTMPLSTLPGAMWEMMSGTGAVLLSVPAKLVGVVQTLAGDGERDPNGPISVIGVARAGGEITSGQIGIADGGIRGIVLLMLNLLIGLNIALFVFNLIPLLPLDGGQVIGAVWEGVKRTAAKVLGRPEPGYVDVAKGLPIAYAVSMALIAMSVLLMYADLVAPVKLGG